MNRYWHVAYLAVIALLIAISTVLYLVMERSQPSNGQPLESTFLPSAPSQPGGPLSLAEIQRFQTALIDNTKNYRGLTWLGQPIWQPVSDIWTLQETIFEVKPELLIECGTYRGGSSYFFAQLFDLMGQGRVITVDIEKLHDLSHPRVTYLIGDSASPEIVQQIREEAMRAEGPIMLLLDSDHSKSHVLRELEAYHDLVTPGSYIHVQDGVIDVLPIFEEARPGPLRAIEEFLKTHDEFEVDSERSTRFLITHHPKGWLKRKSDPAEGSGQP